MSHRQVLDAIRENVKLAVGYTDDVEFSAQDATRTELDFLLECFRVAVEAGATTINVPDTVGLRDADEFGELVRIVREAHARPRRHLDALPQRPRARRRELAGRDRERRPPGGGRGERDRRAGGQLLARGDRDDRPDARAGARRAARPEPEGDHPDVAARLDDDRLLGPAEQGGRGRERVRARERDPPARRAQQPRDLRDHGPARDRPGGQPPRPGQALAGGTRSPTRWRRSGSRSTPSTWTGRSRGSRSSPTGRSRSPTRTWRPSSPRSVGSGKEAFSCSSRSRSGGGTHLSPSATVRLRRGDELIEESAIGDGMIDAACGAIQRAAGVEARLITFNVSSVTGGSDALGDVVVQLDVDGRRVTGRGVSVDVVEASARAYLAAINRAASVADRRGRAVTAAVDDRGPTGATSGRRAPIPDRRDPRRRHRPRGRRRGAEGPRRRPRTASTSSSSTSTWGRPLPAHRRGPARRGARDACESSTRSSWARWAIPACSPGSSSATCCCGSASSSTST